MGSKDQKIAKASKAVNKAVSSGQSPKGPLQALREARRNAGLTK